MISIKQINNQRVVPISIPSSLDQRPIKGSDICGLYDNIYLCARKNSGKTSCVFKILKDCAGKRTSIIIFCSTVHKDENWIEIRKYFEDKGIDITCFTSIYEDGEDQLENLINDIKQEAQEQEADKDKEPEPEICNTDKLLQRLTGFGAPIKPPDEDEKEKKPRKLKYRAPDYIIVFDDLSSELKSRSLLSLLKQNRHYKSKVIISSQWLHDLLPESRKQIDLFLIFKGFPIQKIQEIYKDCDSGIPFELFLKIYQKATKKPHSFMYINSRFDQFRRNFNEQFMICSDGEEEN